MRNVHFNKPGQMTEASHQMQWFYGKPEKLWKKQHMKIRNKLENHKIIFFSKPDNF